MTRRAEYQNDRDIQKDDNSEPEPKRGSARRTKRNSRLAIVNEDQASHTDQTDPEDAELEFVRTRLAELAKLGPDWNSYGGEPPTGASIAAALQLVRLVARTHWETSGERTRPTSISPLPSGGIELEWRNPVELLAVDVAPDGRWGYLRKRGSGRDAQYEEGTDLTQDQLLRLVAEVMLPRS